MPRYTSADFQNLSTVPEEPPSLQQIYEETMRSFGSAPSAQPAAASAAPAVKALRSGSLYWAAMAGTVVLVVVAVVFALRAFTPAAPLTVPQATPRTQPTAPALPTTSSPALAPGLAAYFAPGGDLAPSLPAGAAYTAQARYHSEWVQLQVEGYAQPVWVRADTVPGLDIDSLPDLAPPPTPTPAPIVVERRIEVPVIVPCTAQNASYTATHKNIKGSFTAFSCVSQAEAEANAEAALIQLTGEGSMR